MQPSISENPQLQKKHELITRITSLDCKESTINEIITIFSDIKNYANTYLHPSQYSGLVLYTDYKSKLLTEKNKVDIIESLKKEDFEEILETR